MNAERPSKTLRSAGGISSGLSGALRHLTDGLTIRSPADNRASCRSNTSCSALRRAKYCGTDRCRERSVTASASTLNSLLASGNSCNWASSAGTEPGMARWESTAARVSPDSA